MWRTEENIASLSVASLSAKLNPLRSAVGLFDIGYGEQRLEGANILQVRTRAAGFDEDDQLCERYVRGSDMFASYALAPRRPIGLQLEWRSIHHADLSAVGLELIISVETDLLDADPGLTVGSTIPQGTVWRLTDAERPQFEHVNFAENLWASYPPEPPAMLLYRPAELGYSFIEMIHPGDFAGGMLAAPPQNAGRYLSSFRLFEERLEKGVIRRGRLQGIFLERQGDQASAWDCYRRFVASQLPLTA
jgi:hypothetical protein